MRKIILTPEKNAYYTKLFYHNGRRLRGEFKYAMFGFLTEIEETAKNIIASRLPNPNISTDKNFYAPIFTSEIIRCEIHNDKMFTFQFERVELVDVKLKHKGWDWNFVKHDMFE